MHDVETLVEALVAGYIGIFFTHRIFVRFILQALSASREIREGGTYPVSVRKLALDALEIGLGLVPLGYGVVMFISWTWHEGS
jgi:hypothetical protein